MRRPAQVGSLKLVSVFGFGFGMGAGSGGGNGDGDGAVVGAAVGDGGSAVWGFWGQAALSADNATASYTKPRAEIVTTALLRGHNLFYPF